MAAFGLGIATVLLLIGLATRQFLQRWRGRMMAAGHRGKVGLGVLLMIVGLAILLGIDRWLEAAILSCQLLQPLCDIDIAVSRSVARLQDLVLARVHLIARLRSSRNRGDQEQTQQGEASAKHQRR